MSTRLLICDKDGTLINPASGAKFVDTPWDQKPIIGVKAKLEEYAQSGWDIIIASNQGGVAASHKTLENCILEMRFCLELFPEIVEAYFAPDFEGNACWQVWGDCGEEYRILHGEGNTNSDLKGSFRKPNPGMLNLAMRNYRGAEEVIYVGDRPEDEGAAKSANVSFFWANEFFSDN